MLKEKFKEVGRINNEIYKEELANIKESILGVSGSYFTKKIFEGVYAYSDHSIGMSVRMVEQKVAKFMKLMEKYCIQVIIVFENQLSVRLNQRNTMLKRTLVEQSVQFVNTPYSEHAQLLYYLKSNLISGIVSELDVIKYFSETNNYVIVDFDFEGGSETFEWIHVSKFLASMNLTLHYARQLLLQELSQRKAQKDVIQQFDTIQRQKNFDRDSTVNHPFYKDQLFRIEYVPVINLSCQLQFYHQTIETHKMEERLKKHFGQLLPPTLYQFFAFDFISSDIFNQFGKERFKYIPNIYDSRELKSLLAQTCQHYERVVSLIKQYLPETSSRTEPSSFISEGDELPSDLCPPPRFNYEFVYTDLIFQSLFSEEKDSKKDDKEQKSHAREESKQTQKDINQNKSQSFALLKILSKYVDTLRKNSKNTSRKNSEQQATFDYSESSHPQRQRDRNVMEGNDQSTSPNKPLDLLRLNSLLNHHSQSQLEGEEPVRNFSTRQIKRALSALQIFSLAALNFFHLQELVNLQRQQFTQLSKYLCKCNQQFSEQLLIFSHIIQNETLCGIFFSNLSFDPDDKQIAASTSIHSNLGQSTLASSILPIPNYPPSVEDNSQKSSSQQLIVTDQNEQSLIIDQPIPTNSQTSSTPQTLLLGSTSINNQVSSTQNNSISQVPSSTLSGLPSSSPSPLLKSISQQQKAPNQKEFFQRRLIDEKMPIEDQLNILVLSRLFSLSELSFKEWKIDEFYDFELTQYIKIIQSKQSILRNQFDCLILCSYCFIGSNSNMQAVIDSKRYLPFRKNYNCAMGMLIILLLQNKISLQEAIKDEDNFPFIKQELQNAFLLWDNILSFIQLQQSDKYVDPTVVKIGQILSNANTYLLQKIDRSFVFQEQQSM